MTSYADFLDNKTHVGGDHGFRPGWVPDSLFDFQRHLVDWAARKGRAAIYADCGLGKTPIQLVWAENVVRRQNAPVLVLTPLAVAKQTVREGEKFGVDCSLSRDGRVKKNPRVVVTNYQKLHLFDPSDFGGVVCDESSILKDESGKTRAAVTDFMLKIPYRLLCTATAAPNDYVELGTSSEALGELGFQDMVTKFFRKETSKDHLGWGRTQYVMRTHAERDFWRWVCSWAVAVRRPSDLGYDDSRFVLPELTTAEHVVSPRKSKPGVLYDTAAVTVQEQSEERRRTLPERCEKAAELLNHESPGVAWCHLNEEGDALTRMIRGAVQVSGSDPDERKEEVFEAFAAGQIRVLVSKPKIAGFGLNWQHCSHQTFFPSHSFEQWYQAVRRSWRFGQKRVVRVDMVTSPGEAGVLANLKRKTAQTDKMFARLVELMAEPNRVGRTPYGNKKVEVPSWL